MLEKFGSSDIRTKINFIREIRQVCKNFNNIAFNVLRNNFPISVTFKDGIQMKVTNIHDLVFLARHNAWKYCQINEDELQVSFNGSTVKFSDWRHNGDIPRIFIKEDYKSIPAKNSTVIDVGANIGDSSIYFALKGAKKVIAIEPVLANYQCLKKNVKLNDLKNIEFKMVGVAGERDKITIDVNMLSNGAMVKSNKGQEIEMITLEDVVNEYNIESGILKLDCEGYEHEIIMFSSPDILLKFKYIFTELHFKTIKPINEIKQKLEQIGFNVSFNYLLGLQFPAFLIATKINADNP